MDESRTIELHALQERIERGEYEIDPHEVAAAILERLAASVLKAAPRD